VFVPIEFGQAGGEGSGPAAADGCAVDLAVHSIANPYWCYLTHAIPREDAEHDREAVPLAVPVICDYRQPPLPISLRQPLARFNLRTSGNLPIRQKIFSFLICPKSIKM
jgi:hypothetical protein